MGSSRTPERETTPDIEHFIADKLNGAMFSGWYTERIWIEDLQAYRDQIKVDQDELQMIKILKSISRRVKKLRPGFTGIERKNEQICIYVDWSKKSSQIIGHYWFYIEKAFLGTSNMIFELKLLRQVSGNEKSSGRCPHCGKLPIQDDGTSSAHSNNDDPLSLSDIARQLQWKFRDVITPSEWWTEVKPHLTLANVFKFGKFLVILLLAAMSGAANFIIHLASHTNRFVYALSGLMKTSTPFLLACVDVVNRLFAGFFTLIAMVWKDMRKPSNPQETANRLNYERTEARRKYL